MRTALFYWEKNTPTDQVDACWGVIGCCHSGSPIVCHAFRHCCGDCIFFLDCTYFQAVFCEMAVNYRRTCKNFISESDSLLVYFFPACWLSCMHVKPLLVLRRACVLFLITSIVECFVNCSAGYGSCLSTLTTGDKRLTAASSLKLERWWESNLLIDMIWANAWAFGNWSEL